MITKFKNSLARTKRASQQTPRMVLLVLLTILLLAPGLMRDLVNAIPILIRVLAVVILFASMGMFGYLRPLLSSLRRRVFHRQAEEKAKPEAEKAAAPAVGNSPAEKDDEASGEFWDFLKSTAKTTAEKAATAQVETAAETLAVSDSPATNPQPLSDQPEDQETTNQASS